MFYFTNSCHWVQHRPFSQTSISGLSQWNAIGTFHLFNRIDGVSERYIYVYNKMTIRVSWIDSLRKWYLYKHVMDDSDLTNVCFVLICWCLKPMWAKQFRNIMTSQNNWKVLVSCNNWNHWNGMMTALFMFCNDRNKNQYVTSSFINHSMLTLKAFL